MSRSMSARKDPAERQGYLRFFYRDWRPTRLGHMWSQAFACITGLGLMPPALTAQQVRNRDTERLKSTVVVVANHLGQLYLVSMLGNESEWVQNVRAANGKACS